MLTLSIPDHRQTMEYNPRPPQHPTLQTRPLRSPLLPRQRRLPQEHRKHLLHLRLARQRRPSKLRPGQSRRRRPHKNHSQRMGSRVRRARQHRGFRTYCYAVDGGERGGGVCDYSRWGEGCVGDSAEAEGWEGGRGGGGDKEWPKPSEPPTAHTSGPGFAKKPRSGGPGFSTLSQRCRCQRPEKQRGSSNNGIGPLQATYFGLRSVVRKVDGQLRGDGDKDKEQQKDGKTVAGSTS